MEKKMEKVFFTLIMETFMMENGKMERKMEKELLFGRMEQNI